MSFGGKKGHAGFSGLLKSAFGGSKKTQLERVVSPKQASPLQKETRQQKELISGGAQLAKLVPKKRGTQS